MARRGHVFVRPAARTNLWLNFEPAIDSIVASTNTLVAVLNAAALALRPFTIVRTRLVVKLTSDQGAASETPFGAFGAIVVTEQAATAGASSIPNPSTDGDADWYVHLPLIHSFTFGDGTGFTEDGVVQSIDSKAMRKVGINKQVAFMFDMNTGVGGALFVGGRFMVKLS